MNKNPLAPIGLACDHAGFPLMQHIKNWLTREGYPIKDYGTHSAETSVDYPDFAHPLAQAIQQGEVARGIAVCGTGNGISMTLNRHTSVRAALCWNNELAQMARQHNDANVLSLPGRYLSPEEAEAILLTFLTTDFEGGRHSARIAKIELLNP